eukprot:2454469-Ditylum_brightwellii.AAC.1
MAVSAFFLFATAVGSSLFLVLVVAALLLILGDDGGSCLLCKDGSGGFSAMMAVSAFLFLVMAVAVGFSAMMACNGSG